MAGLRQSGTRAIAPQSGSVSSPLGIGKFSQVSNTLTLIQSAFVGSVGNLGVVGSTGVVVLVRNNSANVGNVSNPSGGDPLYPIDQSLFSTTAQRKLAQAYFDGGVGIEKDLAVGGFIYGRIAAANTATTSSNIAVLETNEDQNYYPIFTDAEGLVLQGAQLYADPYDETLGPGGLRYNPYTGKILTDRIAVLAGEASTSPTTGALTVEGGAGVLGDVYVGGIVAIEDDTNSTAIDEGALVVAGGAGIAKDVYVGGAVTIEDDTNSNDIDNGALIVAGGAGIAKDVNIGGITTIQDETNSTAIDNGALVVSGGVGIGQDINVGGNIYPNAPDSGSIGAQDFEWADAYLNKIYSKFLGSTASNLTIAPGGGMTDVFGDLRVRGQNPIGTAPVVTNTLYVTVDGNDTNDGRAMDAGRACRTIGGAMKSPYYQPGTQILVSAGRYLEDNPLEMKPYTSVRGSDIRTTFIEPINKTQDLFYVNSGCYLNYMTFLNGRSGRLEGQYATGYNRGAYCAAFPPQTGANRIDLFQSPYIQNCTNQSGPWLRDGTMFVPNQTVQIPDAIATGSWEANTASIVVSVESGTLSIGQSINAGKQNPGFFNARTLLLANKPFVQSQTVAFVDNTFNSGSFTYNKIKCRRDTGLIIDAIAQDMLHDDTSDSTFAGIQYWNQDGYTGQIPSEITATIAAITHLKSIALVTDNQSTVNGLFDKIIGILNVGTSGITDQIIYGGLPSVNAGVVADYNTLQANKSTLQQTIVDWVNANYPTLVYSQELCYRDVGYIIDSVSFDLLHGGNVQSIKSGVYYYSYNNTSTLDATQEIPQTTAAYNFIKSIISNVVLGQQVLSPFQTGTSQVIVGYNIGTTRQVTTLKNNIDVITNILRNGPAVVEKKTPMSLTENTSTGVLNAYALLIANKDFIKEEVIAFLDQTMNSFEYNRQLCYRDTGIILENIAYDMAFGGNEKSVESGRSYYRGVTSVIAGQETQTISAIDYISYLSQLIVQNEICPVLTPPVNIPTANQVINTALTGGEIAIQSIEKLSNITTNIILNGPDAAPEVMIGAGPDAAFVSAEVLLQANRGFIQESVIDYINYVLCDPPKALPYNQIKCRRDTGVIIDSIATDLLFPTPSNTQATFSGVQYFNQSGYVGAIKQQLGPTIDAVTYLRDLSVKIVQNITTATDALIGVTRYTNGVQTTSSNYATSNEIDIIRSEFGNILTILNGKITGWTDLLVSDTGEISNLPSVKNTVDLLLANTTYLANEVVAYVNANNPGFTYSTSTCARDVGYILQSISFDLLYGGNRQGIQAGLSYYSSSMSETVIPGETNATVDAFTFLANLASTLVQGQIYYPLQTRVKPVINLPAASNADATNLISIVNTITNIIANGPSVAATLVPVTLTRSASTSTKYAYDILKANRKFMIEETIKYLDNTYNPNSFNYNQELCYRDTGLIIDAVSQDILLGGNQKSIEAGVSYWNQGYNYVAGQESTTTAAINYARDLALQVIANSTVTTVTGTVTTQVINPFYQYGGDYMPQEAISRNFGIITNIIENGVAVAPPPYAGGGLFALTGLNGSSVKVASKITSLNEISSGVYRVGLDKPTVGFGDNATLYFGSTLVFPLQDTQVEEKCLELGLDATTWNERKVDPIGAIGGALIDGAVVSDRSPIQSFVFDAYTQLNQGGIGVKVTNNGYSQLVSVFTIFCSIGVLCDNGGIASITNSNCNFGDLSLVAKGYGPRSFSGTVFNPSYRAYPFSPDVPGGAYLDQFYPNGYWPNNGGRVEIFVPDIENRPHIGQVMEVIPPDGHVNEQNLPGFLNVFPSTSTLTTGTINLTGISTTDVYIGNTVRIRDQFGREYDDNGVWYAATGTVVTDVNYNSISFNQALTSGGGDVNNPTFFTLYFCGNSYYTVQTSSVADQPYAPDTNILSANADPYFEGPVTDQISAHITSMQHLKSVVNDVISNITITPTAGNTATQITNTTVVGGANAGVFIDLRFDQMISIIGAANITAAKSVVPQNAIITSGVIPEGAGSAVTLISNNIDFIAEEIAAYVDVNLLSGLGSYNKSKCVRDVKLILQQLIYDLQSGGNYNMVFSGLSYWSRPGSYHIVELGEAVNRPDLFPDGSTVNFYQRSYISASGYLFEYVGAGTNYGALPQRGVADPVQSKETVQLNSGKVFFTSTDQNGDFRIGPGLVISQATGVLSGRTFVQSLYANMTPFILAIS